MPVCSAQSIHRALLSTHEITEDEEEFADRDVTDGGQFACAPVDEGLMRIAHKQRTTLTWEDKHRHLILCALAIIALLFLGAALAYAALCPCFRRAPLAAHG
uniref:Uncharacterized protein n=1 Tax=Chrysotila carterae TaxID=13221 RepID=A0A7S4BED0_CHRCT|mmetsp:Transcript_11130/g.23769  ORF Transcript_11130/g.23769 Transcript_11130/m.23769 type:complete len:102 (-) Transcript_11130:952-1257(-)